MIRSPLWDGFFLLSGLPLAAVFTVAVQLGASSLWMTIVLLFLLQGGHSLSPIVLAWSHRGFRAYMLTKPWKFVALPCGILAGLTLTGIVCGRFWLDPQFDLVNLKIVKPPSWPWWQPLALVGLVYAYWNIYHFGKQNFGVMSLYRRNAGYSRRADLVYSCGTAWATMSLATVHLIANYLRWEILRFWPVAIGYGVCAILAAGIMLWLEWPWRSLPRLWLILTAAVGMGTALVWPIAALGIVSMNHWLAAIGLAGHVSGRMWLFALVVILAGVALYCGLFLDLSTLSIPATFGMTAIAFRLGLGQCHFLYDRWVWKKLGDPQVRATIGKELFA